MPNPQSLTGAQTGFGLSTDNSGTDTFLVTGQFNTVVSGLGNLTVQGYATLPPVSTFDSNTTVVLKANNGPVTDTINLNGYKNNVYMQGIGTPGQATLTGGSTVNVLVSPNGNPFNTAGGGSNYVNLANDAGTTTVTLSGPSNTVILNGHATNTVTMTGGLLGPAGGSVVVIGNPNDDDLIATPGSTLNTAAIALSDSGNTVITGDESITVTGGVSNNSISLGDGTNTVTLTGTNNTIGVGGGNNTIDAGGAGATVLVLGADHTFAPPGAVDGDGLSINPKDKITIRGGNNKVFASYENVFVNNVDSNAVGNDLILLGNGNNAVNEVGNKNTIIVGNGINTIDSVGNSNTVIVQDPTGIGTDTVTLNNGTNNVVSLDHAAGAVSAIGTDANGNTTTNTVVQAGANNVSVNFQTGTGNIVLGNGNDSVTANGNNSHIALGKGNNTVVANGAGDTISLGGGNNVVTANGNGTIVGIADQAGATENVTANGVGAVVVVGNGTDTVTANGANAVVVAGNGNDVISANGANALVVVGSGNDKISATGTGNHVTINGAATSTDTTALGSGDVLRATNGTQTITGGGSDAIFLNATNLTSSTNLSGSGNKVFLGSNGSDVVFLDPSQVNNTVTVQALTAGNYSGTVEVTGFSTNSVLDLQNLADKNGVALNNYNQVLADLSPVSGTQYIIALQGGGSIKLDTTVAFQASEFAFSSTTGPV